MSLAPRDIRALLILGGSVVILTIYSLWPEGGARVAEATPETISMAQDRLMKLRQRAAGVPAREETLGHVKRALDEREQGLIKADTAAQAQAQMLQIVRRIMREQQLEPRNISPGQPRPFGAHYGQVSVTVSMEAGIEQLVNLLASLGSQPELIAPESITMGQADPKDKRIPVQMEICGLVDRKLIPEKPRGGLGSFQ